MNLTRTSDPGRVESPAPVRQPNPKDIAREPDPEGRTPAVTTPPYDPITVPMTASTGNPDPMSQQQQQAIPTSIDEANGAWKQRVGVAKVTWGKLTDDELLQTEGHMDKLSGLVQERYAITRDEAVAQIKTFFSQFKTVRNTH